MRWRGYNLAMMKIHLDTDLGGDIDDLCALAMLLRWPEPLDITGITVAGDTDGMRTGAVRQVLAIAAREDIPVAAGAETSQGYYPYDLGLPDEARYWPAPIVPSPNPVTDALDLLKASIDQGATVIGIGPLTNLRLLEDAYPGILRDARLVLMGGYVLPPRSGFPAWRNEDDFNLQVDVASALTVLTRSRPTLVPLPITGETFLCRAQLPILRAEGAGPLGALIARQAEAFAADEQMDARYGSTCSRLPADIINFQHDALACAIALGWHDGVTIEELPLRIVVESGVLHERVDARGVPMRVVTAIDGARFSEFWLETATRVSSPELRPKPR